MYLIAGLGNPGKEYEHTRHNMGRDAVRCWAESRGILFREEKKFRGFVIKTVIEGTEIVLNLPQTYMNDSGVSVRITTGFYRIPPERTVVVHDDIDLALGMLRIVQDRGAGGHHGVESVIKELGTQDVIRLRIGIAPASGQKPDAEKFVLERWTEAEENEYAEVIRRAGECLTVLLIEGVEKAMSICNR